MVGRCQLSLNSFLLLITASSGIFAAIQFRDARLREIKALAKTRQLESVLFSAWDIVHDGYLSSSKNFDQLSDRLMDEPPKGKFHVAMSNDQLETEEILVALLVGVDEGGVWKSILETSMTPLDVEGEINKALVDEDNDGFPEFETPDHKKKLTIEYNLTQKWILK